MKVAVDKRAIIILMMKVLYEHRSIKKVSKGDLIIVDIERYEDLCHDIGILLAKVLEQSSSPYDSD